ncbi:MAG: hypothetical protein IBX64_10280 [Actinobacteria bacterium]|nr:hypothetical protein [Actinomycetota bacterium]
MRKELRNRECFSPSVSVYRWWARRSHLLIGELIDNAIESLGNTITVSDPMSGGGTVAIEAARRGLTVYAQDINPWAALGLETVLKPIDPKELETAANQLIKHLEPVRNELYSHPEIKGAEIVCQLYTRKLKCPSCHSNIYLYPTRLLALDGRPSSNPKTAWYGCPSCGAVTHGRFKRPPKKCSSCSKIYSESPTTPRIRNYSMLCSHCGKKLLLSPQLLHYAKFFPALAQVNIDGKTSFVPGVTKGMRLYNISKFGKTLDLPISDGLEMRALKRMGFKRWRDIYPERQLRAIDIALNLVPTTTSNEAIAQRLRLSIAGFGEMAGYIARWDPRYRKVYEVIANHHYGRVYLSAEVNPLGEIGRGTLSKRLCLAVKAAKWFSGSQRTSVFVGSSENQPITDESVDLVITDPPYFDSVQYGELSQIFIVFGSACGLSLAKFKGSSEAVPNLKMSRGKEEYKKILGRIMRETTRTLKQDGRLLLTFHDKSLIAWIALSEALREGELQVIGISVVHSENEMDHAKHGKQSMTSDLVLECVKDAKRETVAKLCTQPETSLEKNLIAMGLAIAEYLSIHGSISQDENMFSKIFNSKVSAYNCEPIIS